MSVNLKKKTIGFYLAELAAVAAVVSVIRFFLWAPAHSGMDAVIVLALAAGIVLNLILAVKDNDFLMIGATACYSVALVKLLTNSVGSFVDAFQGINMFGDATQVGTILSIGGIMAVSVLLSILASFLKREK